QSAIADDGCRDALREFAFQQFGLFGRWQWQEQIGVRMRINDAGNERELVGVDGAFGFGWELTDSNDALAVDGNVSLISWLAGAVNDLCVLNNEVVHKIRWA